MVVLGGEPEAIAAAVASARNGKQTLLLVPERILGGLFTLGMLNTIDLNEAPEGGWANTGLFNEIYKGLGGKAAFDVNRAKQFFSVLVGRERNLQVRYSRKLVSPVISDQRMTGITVQSPWGKETYTGGVFIDATADADLAAESGVPFTLLREDYGQPDLGMGCTLVLHFSNVNWSQLRESVLGKGDASAGVNRNSIWGFSEITSTYNEHDPNTFLRGLNIGQQEDGSVLVNALIIFGIDPLDPASKAAGLTRGKVEAGYLLSWLRQNIQGFSGAKLARMPDELYVRESRHMIGLYRLTVNDVLESRIFPDAIAFGSYPIDVQAASPENLGFVVGNPDLYSIPIRCAIPESLTNLLMVGRSASFDSLASGSARTVPVGISVGQAMGIAATIALDKGITVQRLAEPENYQLVQSRLMAQGVKFFSGNYANAYPAQPGLPALRQLVGWGLIAGGYGNDFDLSTNATEGLAVNILINGVSRVRQADLTISPGDLLSGTGDLPLTRNRLREMTHLMANKLQLDRAVYELIPTGSGIMTRGELFTYVAKILDLVAAPQG